MDCTRTFCTWTAFLMAAGPLMALAQVPGQQPPVGQPPQPRPTVQVVATVNGDPITQQEVQMNLQAHLQGQQVDPQAVQKLQQQVVDNLIDSRLVEQYVVEKGPAVEPMEVTTVMNQLTTQLDQQNSSLDEFLASRGYTAEILQTRIEGSLAWQKFQQQLVTEENLQRHFQENKNRFNSEELEPVRQEVANSYLGNLWRDIVGQMKPEAEIRVASPPQAQPAPSQPAPIQPQP